LLIATDVAARGIDVTDVTHVINYSLPDEIANYTHRSGRTGRAGKSGISIAIINSRETGKIRQIEKQIGKQFTKAEIPSGFDVVEKQLFGLIHKVNQVEVNDSQIDQYLPRIMDEFADVSKEDIIKRFVSLEFNRFLEYYNTARDLNAAAEERGDRSERGERGERSERGSRNASEGFTRLFINLGAVDDFSRGDLLGYICNNTGITGKSVGKIDMKGVFSFFEVETEFTEKVIEAFKPIDFHGRDVRIEISGESTGGGDGERRGGGERRSGGGGYGGGERRSGGGGYGGGERRSGGGGDRRSSGSSGGRSGGGERRSSGESGGNSGGFRDYSGGNRRSEGGSGDSGNRGGSGGGGRRRRTDS
jgi:ATP-dependent RNA helicase DeaD